jgi:hypothetical protein
MTFKIPRTLALDHGNDTQYERPNPTVAMLYIMPWLK